MIVSLHVASGAAGGALTRSRPGAIALGLVLHALGDTIPHHDIESRRFEIWSGVVCALALELTPGNVVAVPISDCTLCLSVWHHFVRYHGLERATEMLESIWAGTRKVLFFDTGENEMTPEYRLPQMTPDPGSWLSAYLAEALPESRVEHLGMHAAFDPSGRPCERNLFAVIRI